MEMLTQFIAPIVSLWVIHNAIFSSAGFVNKMRETVISGIHEGKPITPEHRKAIFIDWILCVAATVAVCSIFAGIVYTVSDELVKDYLLRRIGFAIALYPGICAAGFLICSYFDLRLMWRSMKQVGRSRVSKWAPRPLAETVPK